MTNRTKPKQRTIEDIAKQIEEIIGDDEILSHIAANYLSDVLKKIDNNNLNVQDPKTIPIEYWPYEQTIPNFEITEPVQQPQDTASETKVVGLREKYDEILENIQKEAKKKIKLCELIQIAKITGNHLNIPFKKKNSYSKHHIAEWMFINWDRIQVELPNIITLWEQSNQA